MLCMSPELIMEVNVLWSLAERNHFEPNSFAHIYAQSLTRFSFLFFWGWDGEDYIVHLHYKLEYNCHIFDICVFGGGMKF